MITYSADQRTAYCQGVSFRKDMKTGYYLASKPTNGKTRERLHVFVWRTKRGEIPDGYHVHHIDGNKNNNEIDNLACVLRHDHVSYHTKMMVAANPEKYRAHMDSIRPLAASWHKSQEGRAWHSNQAKKQKREKKEFVCEWCGKPFATIPCGLTKYCSNACKASARRNSGVDDEKRECAVCGKGFKTNKYNKTESCSRKCASVLRWNRIHQKRGESACIQHACGDAS